MFRCSFQVELLGDTLAGVIGTHANTDAKADEAETEEREEEGKHVSHIAKLLLAVVEDGDDGKSCQHDQSKKEKGGEDQGGLGYCHGLGVSLCLNSSYILILHEVGLVVNSRSENKNLAKSTA